jgi:hypothetical protein
MEISILKLVHRTLPYKQEQSEIKFVSTEDWKLCTTYTFS